MGIIWTFKRSCRSLDQGLQSRLPSLFFESNDTIWIWKKLQWLLCYLTNLKTLTSFLDRNYVVTPLAKGVHYRTLLPLKNSLLYELNISNTLITSLNHIDEISTLKKLIISNDFPQNKLSGIFKHVEIVRVP